VSKIVKNKMEILPGMEKILPLVDIFHC